MGKSSPVRARSRGAGRAGLRAGNDAYEHLHAGFRWQVPAAFNIAEACCGRWARRPGSERHVAIAWQNEAGESGTLS